MKAISDSKIAIFSDFIKTHDFFFVAGHKEPDGDAIYSCLAIAEILKSQNKEFQLISAGPFKRVEIRKYEKRFSNSIQFLSAQERNRSALLMLDCSEKQRLGDIQNDLSGLDTFIIDHHKTADCQIFNAIIEPSAPATCSLVQILYEKIVGPLNEKTARYLFTGLSTDTGFFRFLDSTSGEIFEMASRLVKAGADPRKIHDFITGGKPYSTRKLLAILLERAKRYFDGRLIATFETPKDTQKWGREGRDTDLLYSSLLAVVGVQVVLFVREESENCCTAGLRSKGELDVSAIAAKFGGGGHKNAAGLSVDGNAETVLSKILGEFSKVF